jgi:hypothetical protein
MKENSKKREPGISIDFICQIRAETANFKEHRIGSWPREKWNIMAKSGRPRFARWLVEEKKGLQL